MTILLKIALAALAVVSIIYLNALLDKLLRDFAEARHIASLRVQYVRKVINISLVVVGVLTCSFIFGFGYHQVFIFLSSVLAVIGVALFAQWSILSHLTAGVIIFFAFPYRVGDRVRVVDPDEDISGKIVEIASFHVLIRRDDGSTVTYPNSALLQKPVIKLSGTEIPQPQVEHQSDTV